MLRLHPPPPPRDLYSTVSSPLHVVMLSDSNLRGGERASDWYKVCHATRNDVGKGKAFSFVRSSLDDGDCKDIYGNRTVTKATKRRRRARSMEDGSDEREEKADRKSGFNALFVVSALRSLWMDGWMDGSENDQLTKAAKNSSAHEIRVDH